MDNHLQSQNIKPRILYQVAKAAWDGELFARCEGICRLVQEEIKDKATRRQVANQIRIAMGLPPHDSDTVISENDREALLGLDEEPVIVVNSDACIHCPEGSCNCENICPVTAITRDEMGKVQIDRTRCLGDGHCIEVCSFGALAEKANFVPLIDLLKQRTYPVYASVAPAFAGQFGPEVTSGKLRSALIKIGFEDMIETALYADLVTIKEAFEFDHYIKTDSDFLITSCCCPVWIKLIENKFPGLLSHISPSVSPMIASGRVIKKLEPDAKVVFIGPCIAKKSEAALPELRGAIDFAVTFQELETIFAAAGVNPAEQQDEENAQASRGGRIYGHTGGVSAAVETTLAKLVPHRAQNFRAVTVDGIPDCQKTLEQIVQGKLTANFIEGMACKGGCIGGPGRMLAPDIGKAAVDVYGGMAASQTPVENPQVYSLLTRLGLEYQITAMTGTSPMATLLARISVDTL